MLGLAATLDLEIEQLDVWIVFLHGDLEDEIYMEQSKGFEVKGKEGLICCLRKSLYGLKQAPRQCFRGLRTSNNLLFSSVVATFFRWRLVSSIVLCHRLFRCNIMEHTEIYGKRACQLVKELASAEPGQLTRFNDDLFNQVIKECNVHYKQFYELTRKMQEEGLDVQSARNADHFGMLIHHLSLLRNKRCLMAYMYKRAEIIHSLSWKVRRILPQDIEEKLCDCEKRYFKNHSSALQSYMKEMGSLDLTVDTVPPKDPYIKVRVLEDIGVTAIGDRDTNLARHSIHFLKRTDAEHYIFQGMMEELVG
ncbi:hypothetical protein Nepgr_014995 [Nepenthes gracilis]|uniref:GINS subunit domain-containing protein n=1 Tax=Nepenthes gracilis TaxID=150966 RepID=A0AAD3XQQ6_NEPGR|nr:hypothetical protein Nepgr_014995 [Nepenthes gracilis]